MAGFPEHKVSLPGGSRSSQTDVYVLGRNHLGLVSIAVEGKVDETFDKTVDQWLGDNPSTGKTRRLEFLAGQLGLEPEATYDLRYQLLHRTVAPLLEGKRLHARSSVMLVHSWTSQKAGFEDYERFVDRIGGLPLHGQVSATNVSGLYTGWIAGHAKWLVA